MIDIWRVSDDTHGTSSTYWMVGHTYPPGSHPFADCLGYLLSWHVNHPGHDPIFVTVDIKSEAGSVKCFPAELDTYIGEWFDRNLIVKPSDLSSDLKNLVAASLKSKWPSVGQMAGKFIFHLTGTTGMTMATGSSPLYRTFTSADILPVDTSSTMRLFVVML
jgi:hypothetical protein